MIATSRICDPGVFMVFGGDCEIDLFVPKSLRSRWPEKEIGSKPAERETQYVPGYTG